MLKAKLQSRKLWTLIVPFAIALITELTGYEVGMSQEAIIGLIGLAIAYIFGQSWIDKTVASGQLDVAKNEGLLQANAYIKYLEAQVAELGAGSVEAIVPE